MSNVIPHNWEVPQVFRGRFGTHAGRQRVMNADGHLLLILHQVPGHKDGTDRGAMLYWRKPDGTWRSTGSGATTIGALRAHVEEFAVAVDALEARAATAKRASDWFALVHDSAPLLRVARGFSASTQHVSEAGHRLNLIAATFLPISALGSLLGMNLVHGFEKSYSPWAFWGVAIAAFLIGLMVRASLPTAPRRDP
jgi:hypothetical protein